jgi:Na+-driven multidrug efflux pump
MELLASLTILFVLIWGFVLYIKSLIDAAQSEKWVWFILLLLMWPMFLLYLLKEYKSSPKAKKLKSLDSYRL